MKKISVFSLLFILSLCAFAMYDALHENNTAVAARQPIILWDTSHGIYSNNSLDGSYSGLRTLLENSDYIVEESDAGLNNIPLHNYDIVIINILTSWDSTYTNLEALALHNFVENGGGVLILADINHPDVPSQNIAAMCVRFGVVCAQSDINELIVATDFAEHPIFENVEELMLARYGHLGVNFQATAVAWDSNGLPTIAITQEGFGRVVTIGDASLLSNNYLYRVNNIQFATNLFNWLKEDLSLFMPLITMPLPTYTPEPTNTPTPTYTPTRTPTRQPTRTPTPRPQITDTPVVGATNTHTPPTTNTPIPTPTHTPMPCYSHITDGGFETNSPAWVFGATAYPAGYTTSLVHGGNRAVRLGIPNAWENIYTYSSVWQYVQLPRSAPEITLSLWTYQQSSDFILRSLDRNFIIPIENDPLSVAKTDAQYVLLYDQYGVQHTLINELSNQSSWRYHQFDLTQFAGQQVRLYLGVFNDGFGGNTSMYVDDVQLWSCGGSPWRSDVMSRGPISPPIPIYTTPTP